MGSIRSIGGVSACVVLAASAALLSLASASGCGRPAPRRNCFAHVWAPVAGDVRIAGSFTGWSPVIVPRPYDESWALARLALPPGEHGYVLVEGGKESLDPANPLTTWRAEDGEEVSLIIVPDCAQPVLLFDYAVEDEGEVTVATTFLAAASGAAVDPETVTATTLDGARLDISRVTPETGRIEVKATLPDGKHTIVVESADEDGVEAEVGRVSVWPGRRAPSWHDGVLYQVMIDRFYADDGSPLDDPPTPGARAGGTLNGVRAALERGDFDALGVTGLWLSPVYPNPEEARLGRDGREYEGYHGYWATRGDQVEPRIGGEEALHALVDSAHERGIAVVLDIVPNHVYETHPRYVSHADDGWFNPEGCVCGTDECPWGPNILTCWFTDYLPDIRLQEPGALGEAVDESVAWVRDFDLDGVRVDAVPMMPRGATRRIARGVRRSVFPREATFVMGEVFTGPGIGALDELRAHIGEPGLDSVFDFPLMWALRGAIASGTSGFEEVEAILVEEETSFAGSGVVLARILDNHDVSRFVSAANGDDGGDPWDDPPPQPTDDAPYDRMELALAAMFTLPGLPVLFQGDEIGLAGAGDPDNRRVMPADDALLPRQSALRATVAKLSALRACSSALRRGDRQALSVGATRYAYVRGHDTDAAVLVLISTAPSDTQLDVTAASLSASRYVDVMSGEAFEVESGELKIPMASVSYRILLAADDPCLDALP